MVSWHHDRREASMKATWIIAVCGSLAIGGATAALAADEPDKILKYRQNVMKSVGDNIGNKKDI